MAETQLRNTPRDLIRVFFRWRLLFFYSASLFAVVVLIAAHFVPVRYTSTLTFERRVDETLPDAGLQDKSLQYELAGYNAVERVVEQLHLADGNDAGAKQRRQQIAQSMAENITLEWPVRTRGTEVVSVSVSESDANLAQMLPEMLVRNYIASASGEADTRLQAQHDFLTRQVAVAEANQQALLAEKIALETKVPGLLVGTEPDLNRRMQQNKADLDAVTKFLAVAEKNLDELMARMNQKGSTQPVRVIKQPNPELDRLGGELREYKIELDLAMTLRHMTLEHPAIQTLLKRIDLTEQRIRQTPPEITVQEEYEQGGAGTQTYATKLADAQAEVDALNLEKEQLESQKSGYERMMSDFGPNRQKMSGIMEQLMEVTDVLAGWQKRLHDIDVVAAAQNAKMRIELDELEKARKKTEPSFPLLSQVLGVAFLGGLAFGAMVLFLRRLIDRTVNTPEDAVSFFNVTVHGVIAEILTGAERFRRGTWKLVSVAMVMIVLTCLVAAMWDITVWLDYRDKYHEWPTAGKVCQIMAAQGQESSDGGT